MARASLTVARASLTVKGSWYMRAIRNSHEAYSVSKCASEVRYMV